MERLRRFEMVSLTDCDQVVSSEPCEPPRRSCPTLAASERALITHSIAVPLCQSRQREFYHKCHRCVFRGQPADYVFEPAEVASNGVLRPTPLEIEPPLRRAEGQ